MLYFYPMDEFCWSCPDLASLPQVAASLAEALAGQNLIAFQGEMGAGKTTLISTLCQYWGVPAEEIASPSFSLVNEYRSTTGRTLYHFDFYRIRSLDEAYDIGTLEYLDSGNTCLIEWPSLVAPLLADYTLAWVSLDLQPELGPQARRIALSAQPHPAFLQV